MTSTARSRPEQGAQIIDDDMGVQRYSDRDLLLREKLWLLKRIVIVVVRHRSWELFEKKMGMRPLTYDIDPIISFLNDYNTVVGTSKQMLSKTT